MWLDEYQASVNKEFELNQKGDLTVEQIITPGFYRLLDGDCANRVIMYGLCGKIDDKPIITFVNHMTWAFKNEGKYKDARCERTQPTFPPPVHEVKKIYWYSDGGDGPFCDEW